ARPKQTHRLIAKMPTIAAFAYKHSMGMPYVYPSNAIDYSANFLTMLFKTPAEDYEPNPTLVRALDVLFILHADHEQNCGTNAMRGIGSAHTDPYSAVAGAPPPPPRPPPPPARPGGGRARAGTGPPPPAPARAPH